MSESSPTVASVQRAIESAAETAGVRALGYVIADAEGVRHRGAVGGFDAGAVLHIWSSTKWLTTAAVLALVDREALCLDEPIVGHVDWFADADAAKADITVRHCLSLTAGLGNSHPSISDPSLTLDQSVRAIAAEPLVAAPGTRLDYGGNGFQVAGLAAERAAGNVPFAELFKELVAAPCGMVQTTLTPTPTANPWLGGGAHSSLGDLQSFLVAWLRSSAGDGPWSNAVVAQALNVQTEGTTLGFSPYPGIDVAYGLGVWIDDPGRLVSSQGMAGCTPWMDITAGQVGCLLMDDAYLRARPVFLAAVDASRLDSGSAVVTT